MEDSLRSGYRRQRLSNLTLECLSERSYHTFALYLVPGCEEDAQAFKLNLLEKGYRQRLPIDILTYKIKMRVTVTSQLTTSQEDQIASL